MKYLEPILRFLVSLIRVIFPKPIPAVPNVPHPPLPPDAGNGGNTGRHRGDSVAAEQTPIASELLNASGCCLMVAGGIGCLLKHLL